MNYSSSGTSALKMHIYDMNRDRELKEEMARQEKLKEIHRKKRMQQTRRKEVVLSVILSFIVSAIIIYGYIGPTALSIEVNELEQELHLIKGIRNDKIAEVESLKADNNVIETAQDVLGMVFASEDDYVKIPIKEDIEEKVTEDSFLRKLFNKITNMAILDTK